jgi:hypothetical protein
MRPFLGQIRRIIRFALACLIWLHAIFLAHLPSPNLPGLAGRLHLTTSEIVVFVLLIGFSLLATYGYGRLAVDVLYIYSFPIVLLYILVKRSLKALAAINKFCMAGTSVASSAFALPTVKVLNPTPSSPEVSQEAESFSWRDLRLAIARPFRQFTLLWCLLLLFTTHQHLLELALAIVVIHIVFILVTILRVTLFSAGILANLEGRIRENTDALLAKISCVTRETEATPDLRNTWTNLSGIKMGMLLLQNGQLVSRWAAVLGSAFLGCIYLYLAVLFSFIYYGTAHVQRVALSWPTSFVTSLFIPFAFGDLPSNFWVKLVGGIHCTVILAIGAGTVINYVTRRAHDLQKTAIVLSRRFADEEVQARLLILEEKFKPPANANPPPISQ